MSHNQHLITVGTKKFRRRLAEIKTAFYYCARVYRGWPVLRLAFLFLAVLLRYNLLQPDTEIHLHINDDRLIQVFVIMNLSASCRRHPSRPDAVSAA
jgi:hypothetical protein